MLNWVFYGSEEIVNIMNQMIHHVELCVRKDKINDGGEMWDNVCMIPCFRNNIISKHVLYNMGFENK